MTDAAIYSRIGFTGTRESITSQQVSATIRYLQLWRDSHGAYEFHHGDCVGADAEACAIAARLSYRIVSHPPTYTGRRAFMPADEVRARAPYLTRNRDIVDEADLVLALPSTDDEVLRSGAWATIRYARQQGKRLVIVGPQGKLTNSGFGLERQT